LINGETVASGTFFNTYLLPVAPYGQSCSSAIVKAFCENGLLSNRAPFNTCTMSPTPSPCIFNGKSVASETSITAFEYPQGSTCKPVQRTCHNGVLTGSAQFSSCNVVVPISPELSCNFDGKTMLSNAQSIAYQEPAVPYGAVCNSELITCKNGLLSGKARYATCLVKPPPSLNCLFNGKTVANGSSVSAYMNQTSPNGSSIPSCVSENRLCTNGTLSGTAQYESCAAIPPIPPTSCLFNSKTIANGESVSAYKYFKAPVGGSCVPQIRICKSGILDGSYPADSCVVEAAP
jgi:hypothetical protein